MDESFRLISLRPPRKLDQGNSVPVEPAGAFAVELRAALLTDTPRALVKRTAQTYAAGEAAVKDLTSLKYQQQCFEVERAIVSSGPNLQGVLAAISGVFTVSASVLVAASEYARDVERIGNSIIALKLASTDYVAQLDPLARLERVIALIRRAAASDASVDTPGAAALALSFPIVLPGWLFPLSLVPSTATLLQPCSGPDWRTQTAIA